MELKIHHDSMAATLLLGQWPDGTSGWCAASDALVDAGYWTNDGEVTEEGEEAREEIRLRRYAFKVNRGEV